MSRCVDSLGLCWGALIRNQLGLNFSLLMMILLRQGNLCAQANWPFTPPTEPVLPEVVHQGQVTNEIDRFILQALEKKGWQLTESAEPRVLIRRLFFDLIGLPPSPEEVEAFLQDKRPEAYAQWVDRLLDDPRHGERWAKFWLDLARYADTAGYEGDPDLPHAWRYRDYVIDAFNKDKPYDLFVREQIAGDEFAEIMGAGELPEVEPEKNVAMTFLRLAPFTEPRGDETRHELLSEMTSTVSSVFLGLTVGCAKCHDHKYDQIPTRDFYRMKAFFNTVQLMPPERGDAYQIGGSLPAAFYRTGEESWATSRREEIQLQQKSFDTLRKKIATRMRNQSPDTQSEMPDEASLESWIDQQNPPNLTAEERTQYYELKHLNRFANQQLRRLEPRAMSLRHSFGPPYEPGVPVTHVMIRGEHDHPGEPVQAGFLSCITGNTEPATIRLDPFKRWPTRSRRMALANWIASPNNPLTARVMVNRIWMHHFGRGLVRTPSDFGALSGGPSHEKLLDWLALRFIEEGWSLKAMHRLMVLSSTYRQASTPINPQANIDDPDNVWLSHFNRRRLEAEAIRDQVLSVSGRLNPERYGLPIFPSLPDGIEERVKYSKSKWATSQGPEARKRSLYIYQQRTLTMPFLQSFDGLVCEDSMPRRSQSVTPLQALEMYNGQLVEDEAPHFANRVIHEAGNEAERRIDHAFLIALSRRPDKDEQRMLIPLARTEAGMVRLARILMNLNEFVYID
jgi:hypothetical protein